MSKYPSKVICLGEKGKALVATEDLPKGTIVEKFEGPIIKHAEVPEEMVCHAIFVGETESDDKWIDCRTNAIFANHSCDPNCRLDDNLYLVTRKKVKKGEELTWMYNLVDEGKADNYIPDHRSDFECKCGAKHCQKIINKYVDSYEWYKKKRE